MHLIVQYHRQSPDSDSLEDGWLPTWRIDGPDEPTEPARGTSISLSGETRLPIITAGEALESGSIYLDLKNPAQGPFRALEGQTAGEGNAYVSQGELPVDFWNQLVRVCARAGDLVFDVAGASFDIILVLEPIAAAPAAGAA
ncbi:MAG: hypothetical protein KF883_10370 [Thermomicrobiales bacterium]|nr:hypothetical protein [Thermomicrobiales bacterium]